MLDDFDELTDSEIKKVRVKSNFHTHNHLCGHAAGTVADYVAEAVRHGFEEIGISDHGASPLGTTEPYISPRTIKSDYLPQFKEAEKLYGDRIKIFSGAEIEYFSGCDGYYKELLEDLDYLVLGQHEYLFRGERVCTYREGLDEENVFAYCEQVKAGLKSGYFSLFAHPDVIFYHIPQPTQRMANAFESVVAEAKRTDVPLELNANGVRWHKRRYPTELLISLCKKYGARVMISSDCHSPRDLCDEYVIKLYAYAEKRGLDVAQSIRHKFR